MVVGYQFPYLLRDLPESDRCLQAVRISLAQLMARSAVPRTSSIEPSAQRVTYGEGVITALEAEGVAHDVSDRLDFNLRYLATRHRSFGVKEGP